MSTQPLVEFSKNILRAKAWNFIIHQVCKITCSCGRSETKRNSSTIDVINSGIIDRSTCTFY